MIIYNHGLTKWLSQILKGAGELNIDGIKAKRAERGLTQAQVARKAGVTPIGYQRYEAGERVPNVHTAILIAETLGVKSFKEFRALFGAATPTCKE
ncbi:helix-turn-helix transcriptional regulator [Bittarella massiliensis]|nr:helix-turn-helix transcriptional regulator [Bittarella massiliensis (ex Durand et al. 2017)]